MNSSLYRCHVMHHRLQPREHRFRYNIFMFYLDLDELTDLSGRLTLFSHNRANWFSFRDRDHLRFPVSDGRQKNLKQHVLDYLESFGIDLKEGKVMLLTNVTTLGYAFNPISFYLCFDNHGVPVCSVAEVSNTHGEMKLFLLDQKSFTGQMFRKMVPKLFYVSPFAELSSSFDFIFRIPDDTLHMRVDDYEDNKRFLLSSLTGRRRKLNDMNLMWYGFRFPLVTLRIILLIHWQALILFLKRIPYHRKNVNLHLQQDAYRYKKA